MTGARYAWVRVANFGVGWEADLAVARLDAEDIPARATGNDLVGIFGPGFQGATARGFFVEVPAPLAPRARHVLAHPPSLTDVPPEVSGADTWEDDDEDPTEDGEGPRER